MPENKEMTAYSHPLFNTISNIMVNGVSVPSVNDINLKSLASAMDSHRFADIVSKLGAGATAAQLADAGVLSTVEFDAVTFIYGENANFFDFYIHQLNDFASSFVGKPFLRNHNHNDIGARDGTITTSKNENGQFIQHIKLTTKRGIQSFLEGQIDRFSIGWDYDEATCSICGLEYGWFSDCPHMRGREYNGETCKIVFNNPKGIETSAVNVPAVQGTHILSKERLIMENEKEATANGTDLGALAEGLHLNDMDERIGQAEEVLSQLLAQVESLTALVNELNEKVDAELTALPTQYVDAKTGWNGYKGSKLQVTTEVRKPVLEAGQDKQKTVSVQKLAPVAKKGAKFLERLQQGGNN